MRIDSQGEMAPRASILVVDDEPMLLRGYTRLLRAAGYEVATACDGREARDLVARRDFDVIVSDIAMPGMTGVELLRAIREHNADVPVVLVTGSPTLETAVPALEFGALRYLYKPVDPKALEEVVSRAAQLYKMAKLRKEALALVGGTKTAGEALAKSLDRALDSLWMAYQPIVRWSERRIIAFEALLRTNEQSLPHPGAVLDAAERLGRLQEIGRATRARVAMDTSGLEEPLVFVNLHTSDLLDETLFDPTGPLAAIAQRVVLEITERAALGTVRDVQKRVAKLRALGFRIAIDDLGAGFAGLTSFAQLEPEVVKLDMSLVRDIDREPLKRKLIASMNGLCREMGLLVIAEGVERQGELETLVELGCDHFQGYLFAKPGKPFPEVTWPIEEVKAA